MAITLEQAQADLVVVNSALSELIQGKRRSKLQLQTSDFNRVYEMQDITYDNLVAERTRLEGIIASLTPIAETVPKFRPNTSFPLNVTNKPI
jgi:hypothetical protein